MYKVPDEFYFRLHHVRPRFKGDVEDVLIYIAEKMALIGEKPKEEFKEKVNQALFDYPGNAHRKLKTINNWRTEISSLFGFIEHGENTDKPSRRALELAENQDLVEAFKIFLYNFQYPGAHIKSEQALEQINKGVHFKPAQYILKLLRYASEKEKKSVGITKAEACHMIFNDLRVTRDNDSVENTWNRISLNRNTGTEYDTTGDVVRYAGDIIDYMVIANLLKTYDNRTFYLNKLEDENIIKFCNSKEWFSGYDNMIDKKTGTLEKVKDQTGNWFSYVNRDMTETDLSTDILSYIAENEQDLNKLKESIEIEKFSEREKDIHTQISSETEELSTKQIGDMGEGLVHGHECMRLKKGGREDLIHLVKRIPTQYAIGYDIGSMELDGISKRFIEVKTTISSKPLKFNSVHLTPNEWSAAASTNERYFIYRLFLSKSEKKLFLLQDPVGLYKKDLIDMVPGKNGAEITFNPKRVGEYQELLTWTH